MEIDRPGIVLRGYPVKRRTAFGTEFGSSQVIKTTVPATVLESSSTFNAKLGPVRTVGVTIRTAHERIPLSPRYKLSILSALSRVVLRLELSDRPAGARVNFRTWLGSYMALQFSRATSRGVRLRVHRHQ